jgi:nicotinate-nucleotide adenylyltransferase
VTRRGPDGGGRERLRGALGLFGGTFDPIHLAHLAVAEAARDDLDLAGVTFIPAAQPPHKTGRHLTPVLHRLAMVEAAIADNPRFSVSRIEIDREGPSYTADTLTALTDAGVGPIALILSAEAVVDLPTWHDPERVLALATLVIAPRDGYADIDPDWFEATFPGVPTSVVLLDGPRMRLAASDIRRRAARARSLRYLVPDAVATYIGDHGLYRAERRVAGPRPALAPPEPETRRTHRS